jgi:hypothetical protein
LLGTINEYIDFGDKTFKYSHCKAFFWLDERLARSTKTNPQFSLYCLGGKIRLPRPLSTPHVLDELLDLVFGEASKKFRTNIHAYNSMFAFTSMGANITQSIVDLGPMFLR